MMEGDYISFQKAVAMLAARLSATREEVALWAWLGKRHGGLDAYDSPKRYNGSASPVLPSPTPDQVCDGDRPWTWLFNSYFLKQEIESFDPAKGMGRFISWGDLLTRWQAYGLDEDEVRAKVRGRASGEDVVALAPIFGSMGMEKEEEKEAEPDKSRIYGPDAWAMFSLTGIETIETRDFPGTAGRAVEVDGSETATITESETKNWILLIQAEAARRWKMLRDAGANPTKNNIKDDLAKWCQKNSVTTAGGIYPSAEYIYRHVLRKWMPPTG